MNYWKLDASLWSKESNFYSILKEKGMIIFPVHKKSKREKPIDAPIGMNIDLIADWSVKPNVGDIILITMAQSAKAIVKITENLQPADFTKYQIAEDYADILASKADWYELGANEYFSYKAKKPICNIQDKYIKSKINLLLEQKQSSNKQQLNSPQIKSAETNMPLNQILFGPPGTGKTYNSISEAVKIAAPEHHSDDHKNNKIVFDQLRKDGQIEFVTFHQNYAYEDFMVGIRPNISDSTANLSFKKHTGIFYEIAKRARENYENSLHNFDFDRIFAQFIQPLSDGQFIKLEMVSGKEMTLTGLSKSDSSIEFEKPDGKSEHNLSIKTIKEIIENNKETPVGLVSYYNPVVQELKKRMELKNYVLIIDEINRANISKVFGELITLLEDDKRLGAENELRISLPNGEGDFAVPPNLYLIGTMNTADKSIALIDIALRRRFEFVGFYPNYDKLTQEASELLQKINEEIYKRKNSADYLIGHAYFMKKDQDIKTVLKNKVVPLLMEYFAGKTKSVEEIFNDTSWEVKYNTATFNWEIDKSSK